MLSRKRAGRLNQLWVLAKQVIEGSPFYISLRSGEGFTSFTNKRVNFSGEKKYNEAFWASIF